MITAKNKNTGLPFAEMCSWCFAPVGCPKGIYHYWLELVLSRALKQVEVVACLKLGCSKVIFTPHRPICSGSPWILENPIGQRTILNSPLKWISGLIMSLWFPGIRFLRFFLSFLGLLAWDLRTAPMFIPKAPVDPLGTKLSRPCFSRGRSAFQVREGTPPDTSYPTKGQPSISTLLDSASLDFPAWMCCRARVGCGNFAPGRKNVRTSGKKQPRGLEGGAWAVPGNPCATQPPTPGRLGDGEASTGFSMGEFLDPPNSWVILGSRCSSSSPPPWMARRCPISSSAPRRESESKRVQGEEPKQTPGLGKRTDGS